MKRKMKRTQRKSKKRINKKRTNKIRKDTKKKGKKKSNRRPQAGKKKKKTIQVNKKEKKVTFDIPDDSPKKKKQGKTTDYKGYNINDVEFSKKLSKGTQASSNEIEYHYQNLDNIIEYLKILSNRKMIDNINFFKNVDNSLIQVDINNSTVESIYSTNSKFVKELKSKSDKYRFTPITINTLLPLPNGSIENHANMLLVDNKTKDIELFEPHGYKPKESTESQAVSNYNTKVKILTKFCKKILPSYTFVNSVDFIKGKSFQELWDSNSGFCVTWSAIFVHYRILNPHVPTKIIVEFMNKFININSILRYAHTIEDYLKKKK